VRIFLITFFNPSRNVGSLIDAPLFSIGRCPCSPSLRPDWDFNDQDLLTPHRGVLFLRKLLKVLISQSGIFGSSLETGCTDVETQAHARVLGL
jgi:hypothetical protein